MSAVIGTPAIPNLPIERQSTTGSLNDSRASPTSDGFDLERARWALDGLARDIRGTRRENVKVGILPQIEKWLVVFIREEQKLTDHIHFVKAEYKKSFNPFQRYVNVFPNTRRYYKENVGPLKARLALLSEIKRDAMSFKAKVDRECQEVEIRVSMTGGVSGSYNRNTGKVLWSSCSSAVCGAFDSGNSRTAWKKNAHGGVAAVWNECKFEVETKVAPPQHSVAGVYNPNTREVEFKEEKGAGVSGVYNPDTKRVDWAINKNGCVVGWWDSSRRCVQWVRRPARGMCAVARNLDLGGYTSSVCYFPGTLVRCSQDVAEMYFPGAM
eukprot:GHVU01070651.1.p1 GENE.GHVU01070651.1~~GHVU01070651.1.p1  ORF type:complete len:325 (-),score=39.07 GHVU01070651.1:546-1520(-)